jgi:nucleotide-binding universal stress UspA family protein
MRYTTTALRENPAVQEVGGMPAGYQDDLLNPAGRRSSASPTTGDRPPEQGDRPRGHLVRKILVPTDFSPRSTIAVNRAVVLANQCDAVLTILHVIDANAQPAGVESGTAEDLMKYLWSEGAARMGQLAWSLCGQVEAQTTLEEGLPWETIVEKSRGYDLLILGTARARSGWKLFSKQTARRVIENADCPVMVVRDGKTC